VTEGSTSSASPLAAVIDARERGDVDAIIEALADTDREVRWVAANSLRSLKSPKAVEALLRLARDSRDESLRILALKALGATGDPRVASALLDIASEEVPFGVRVTAISALADLKVERAIPLLSAIVADERLARAAGSRLNARSSVRWAIRRLVELNAVDAVPVLERALAHLGLRERRHARRAIRLLRSTRRP
jgi:HEAT repeat protein